MKKILLFGLIITLFIGGMSSCQKTRRGKIAKDWSVSKSTKATRAPGPNGTSENTDLTFEGTTGKMVTTFVGATGTQVTTKNGVVNELSYSMDKSGTWSSVSDIVWTSDYGINGSKTETIVMKSSGTWSFLGKNKDADFKKNERIVFSMLSSSTTTKTRIVDTGIDDTTNTSSNETYAEGENSTVYLIDESKRKSLTLSRVVDEKVTGVDANGSTYESNVSGTESIELDAD